MKKMNNNKPSYHILTLLFILAILGCSKAPKEGILLSYSIKEFDVENNKMYIQFDIENNLSQILKGGEWTLHWNQMKGFIDSSTLPDGIDFEWVNGAHYFILKFNEKWTVSSGENIRFSIVQNGIMDRLAMGPMGAFIVQNGQAIDITTQIHWQEAKGIDALQLPTAKDRYQRYAGLSLLNHDQLDWVVPTPYNTQIQKGSKNPDQQWQIALDKDFEDAKPQISLLLKSLFTIETSWESSSTPNFYIKFNKQLTDESYRLQLAAQKITIHTGGYPGLVYGLQSLRQIITTSALENTTWPLLTIQDTPRFGYRGFLLDIARNFYGPEKIKQVLDVMSLFKLNYLDFRLTDDEGWRIEIPGLPELTDIGAQRGYTKTETERLIPMYGSGAYGGSSGNGYLKREDFVELLKYANLRGIKIMPQISFPSHARAAIKAMDSRYQSFKKEGKDQEAEAYRLSDPDDQSEYLSAQNYNDNIICICKENAYAFFEKVVNEIVGMYAEAEAPLERFSIGADELPYGVWTASPICDDFIANNDLGITDVHSLYAYNLNRLKTILGKHQLQMAGWEDILLDHSEKSQGETSIKTTHFDYNVIPYVWNNTWGEGREDMIYKFANLGFKTVMSNSSAFYFDMADDRDMENFGLNWSGFVDYKDSWGTDPEDVFGNHSLNKKHGITQDYIDQKEKLLPDNKHNLQGIQGQLWTETVKSTAIFDELLYPNLFLFAERAWAARTPWMTVSSIEKQAPMMHADWNRLTNTLGQRTLPLINTLYNKLYFDLPKPGAIIENDSLKVRVQFPGLTVRYTTDGSEPDQNSKVYTNALKLSKNQNVQLKAFDHLNRGGKSIKLSQK